MEMFMVGGAVRDELLGVKSKDIDFTVVLEDKDFFPDRLGRRLASERTDPFSIMVKQIEAMGVKVIRDNDGKPVGADYFTARGIAPKDFPLHPGRALDFVLARKESEYTDGRRPDKVEVGTLEDDLRRRDFTMNAIAKATDGTLIDPFGGREDIESRIIRAVGDPMDRFTEDALRALRALRFSVTKGFKIDLKVAFAMEDEAVLDLIHNKISDERKKDELNKMFAFDAESSVRALMSYPLLMNAIFAGSVKLQATMKEKIR